MNFNLKTYRFNYKKLFIFFIQCRRDWDNTITFNDKDEGVAPNSHYILLLLFINCQIYSLFLTKDGV